MTLLNDGNINSLTSDGNDSHVPATPDQDVDTVVDTLQTARASSGIGTMITEQGPRVNREESVSVLGNLSLLCAKPPKSNTKI